MRKELLKRRKIKSLANFDKQQNIADFGVSMVIGELRNLKSIKRQRKFSLAKLILGHFVRINKLIASAGLVT